MSFLKSRPEIWGTCWGFPWFSTENSRGRSGWQPDRPRPTALLPPRSYGKPEAATAAVDGLLMMGIRIPQTCWTVFNLLNSKTYLMYQQLQHRNCGQNTEILCSAHNAFISFAWISEPIAIISLYSINTLNPELNPICYLLALLGAHHFLHVSRIRVKLLTFRRLMSYIYIYMEHPFLMFLDHTQRRSTFGRTPLDEW